MLKIEMLFNSGETRIVTVQVNDGADAAQAAEKVAEAFSKMEWYSSQDANTKAWFYVKVSDVSFASVTVVSP